MLLSSALYFKGDWVKAFESPRTKTEKFKVSEGEDIDARFMNVSGKFNYYKGSDFQMIELPYRDGEVAMDVILPDSMDDLRSLEKNLSSEQIDRWMTHLSSRDVAVSLPQFEFDSTFEISDLMKKMGIEDAFNPKDADFSAMTGTKDLFLGRFQHKTFVSVTDLGTEAGSGGAGTLNSGRNPASAALPFVVNRPFLFGVRHRASNTFILLGKVVKPVGPVEQE